MSNAIAKQKPKFSVAITTPSYQKLISNTLQDPKRVARFTAAITSAVAVNPALQECDAGTILAGALLGESLNLTPSPQLGQYYLVPFDVKVRDGNNRIVKGPDGEPLKEKRAQFVLGYKGYIQLAIRSGMYKKLTVLEIKQGELVRYDPLNEEIVCAMVEDTDEREALPTIGYYAMFEYVNGFRKAMYWSKGQMERHANQFSPAFNLYTYRKILNGEIPNDELWKYSSFWYKDFDTMGKKTMLRQLISHWGVMSIEMQQAFEADDQFNRMDNSGNLFTEPAEVLPPEQPILPPQGGEVEPEGEPEGAVMPPAGDDGVPLSMDDL